MKKKDGMCAVLRDAAQSSYVRFAIRALWSRALLSSYTDSGPIHYLLRSDIDISTG